MRILTILAMLGLLVLAAGCSDDGPTEPGNGQPGDEFVLEATATVGAAGGSLETAELALRIPAGAFAADQELSLYSCSEQEPFDESTASKIFRIDGIPDDFASPLRLAIRYGEKRDGESFVAWGEEVRVPNSGEISIAYHMVAADDSLGFLVGMIPAPEPDEKSSRPVAAQRPGSKSGQSIMAGAVTGATTQTDAENHFRIIHLGLSQPSAASDSLLAYLNRANVLIRRLYFDVSRYRQWPVEVTIHGLRGEISSQFTPSRWSHDQSKLEFDSGAIFDFQQTRVDAFHEFALLVFSLFDPRGRIERAIGLDPHWLWLNEAAATWFEYGSPVWDASHSTKRAGNQLAPLNGMHAGAFTINSRRHGYGMSALIRYKSNDIFGGSLFFIYESISQNWHVIPAILMRFGSPVDFLPDFFHQYLSKSIYPDFHTHEVLFNISPRHQFYIDSPAVEDTTFTLGVPDLTARFFDVVLEDPDMDPGAEIIFTAQGRTAPIMAYTYSEVGGDQHTLDLALIAESANEMTIRGVKDYSDQGKSLLFQLTNTRAVDPFTDETDFNVTIQVSRALPYTHCYFKVDVIGQYRDEANGIVTYYDERIDTMIGYGEGSFDGNTFIGSWEVVNDIVQISWDGSVTAVLNPARDGLLSLYANETVQLSGSPASEYSLLASDIPLDRESLGDLGFLVLGEQACDHIDDLEYNWGLHDENWSKTIEGQYCNSLSEIVVYFDNGR